MPLYTYTTLDDPNGSNTQAYGINNAGQIVGEYDFAHGFLYSGGNYTTIDDGTVSTIAWGISGLGQIVGEFTNNGVVDGFRLSGGTYTTLFDTDPAAFSTVAHSINTAGQIVGAYSTNTAPFVHLTRDECVASRTIEHIS